MTWIINLMKMKFNVRVKYSYYYNNKSWYVVQYAYFKIFPKWKNIYKFYGYTTEGYHSDKMFTNYDSAVEFAKTLKTIEDVNSYHHLEHEKYGEWKKAMNEIWNRTKPQHKVTIIK